MELSVRFAASNNIKGPNLIPAIAMATISLYFDTRAVSDENKPVPLKLAINHRSSTVYVNLKISLTRNQWNGKRVVNHPQQKLLNESIKRRKALYEAAVFKLEETANTKIMTAKEYREALELIVNPEKAEQKVASTRLLAWFRTFLSHKNPSTRRLYEVTLRRVEAFLGKGGEKVSFDDINKEWLQRFDEFLAKTAPSANGRGIHMRNLRAVFNDAISNEITTNYPFRRFKIKREETRKRNFKVETLRRILNAEGLEPWQVKYRDFFKLTFMLIGINCADLCNLTEVKDGRVHYVRAKTHKSYSIKAEPEILELIEQYKGEKHLLNFTDTYKDYRLFYNNLCKGLRSIRDFLNENRKEDEAEIEELTTYWARHSWATIAAKLDIPDAVIASALGHGTRTVTDIYIEREMGKVDEANRRVLNYVFKGWPDGYEPEPPKKRGRPKKTEK